MFQSCGQFYRPSCVSADQFKVELDFFGLTSFHDEFVKSLQKQPNKRKNAVYNDPQTIVQRLWNFFKDPKSSQAARVWAIIDVIAISVAVILFIVETMPKVKTELRNPNKVLSTGFFVAETACVVFFSIELIGKG